MAAVFYAERWAEAFIASCSDDDDAAFESLKAMIRGIGRMEGRHIAGTVDAKRVEIMVRTVMKKAVRSTSGITGAEIACRTLSLLVRRGLFRYRHALIEAIGIALDRKKRILSVTLETAAPLSTALMKDLEQSIKEQTNAGEVRLTERIAPDILGGYKLRIGTRVIDASVRSLLQNMAKEIMR
ncbi:MAG: F0F1 ATP synthase subunit delta [Treponema sp.]|jgi:F0F1-type ATP synthase delta subunit|nr:F0F1 ATP synthase subunit delta [Treponema sp.]